MGKLSRGFLGGFQEQVGTAYGYRILLLFFFLKTSAIKQVVSDILK
jgi:hypothetical protein